MNESPAPPRVAAWFAGGTLLLLGAVLSSLVVGAFSIPLDQTLRWLSGAGTGASDGMADRVLWSIRLPRVVGAAAVGAALASTGAVLQGTFCTSLADPQFIGYSSAAGAGAALGFSLAPIGSCPLLPVALAVLCAGTYGAATAALRSRTGTDRFLLSGVAFGFAFLAWTGLFVLVVDSPRVPTFLFFVFGSLAATTWKALIVTLVVIVPSVAILWRFGPALDLLALGETDAGTLGLDTGRFVPMTVVLVGAAVGASVALGGVVGFVGLLAPFVLRSVVGPHHRVLIPASALGGAILVVTADTIARTVASPAEVPLGLITAAVGGPFLGWLLLHRGAA